MFSIGARVRLRSNRREIGTIRKLGDGNSVLIEFDNGKWGWYRPDKLILAKEKETKETDQNIVIQSNDDDFKDIPKEENVAPMTVTKEFPEKEKQTFLKVSAEKKKQSQSLPSLKQMQSDMKKADDLTQKILSQPSSNNLNDRGTLLNILGNMSKENGNNILFYDSNDTKLPNPTNDKKELKFTLNLKSFEQKIENEMDAVMELKSCIDSKSNHPILEDYKQKLSKIYNVRVDQVRITDIFCGSVNIEYVIDIPESQIEAYYNQNVKGEHKKLESGLRAEFKQYNDCKIPALLFRDAFDINMFDERGNKTFSSGSTFEVGPDGRKQTYTQPSGWYLCTSVRIIIFHNSHRIRFGLKVLDGHKYGSDHRWLAPFQDPNNWYRCYHGTGSSGSTNGVSVDVMALIYDGGFHYANNTAYGPGVYCSPDPVWLENQYAATHSLNGKKYKFMLQCAVNPGGVRIYQDTHCGKNWQGGKPWGPIWVANTPQDIRPYAVLIKEC